MISMASKVGYASGNLGKAVLWSSLDVFFLFILTELWGVPPAEAGLIIMIALVFDGLAAPLMGVVADRTPAAFGKYGPYLALGAPLCASSFWLLLRPTGGDASGAAILALSLLFRACYTICDVPHNALFSRIVSTARDASFVSGLRFFFSSVGGLIVAGGAGWVLSALTEQAQAERFSHFAAFAGGLYVATIWWAWRATARLDRTLPNSAAHISVRRALVLVTCNRMLLVLFALAAMHCLSVPLFLKGLAYFAKYVRGDAAWSSGALLSITVLQGVSMPVWMWFFARHDKRHVMGAAYLVLIGGLAGFFAFARGSDVVLLAAMALIGFAKGGLGMGLWGFLPDAIHAGASERGETVEALPTGLFLMIIKCVTGLGAGMFGLILNAAGLADAKLDDEAFGDALILVICGGPAIGAIACAILANQVRPSAQT